jgi:hypothetical protein
MADDAPNLPAADVVPDLWPGQQKSIKRGIYNLALRRLNPSVPPTTAKDAFSVVMDGQSWCLLLYVSVNGREHSMRLDPSVASTIKSAQELYEAAKGALIAAWRDNSDDNAPIHAWRIPEAIVDQMDSQLPAGPANQRPFLKIEPHGEGLWRWRVQGRPGLQPIDLTEYHILWPVTPAEVNYLHTFDAGGLTNPAPSVDENAPAADSDTTDDIGGGDGNAGDATPRLVGTNRIYFGPPGVGKSYSVDAECRASSNAYVIRTTFHPEYTYFDFLGTYRPTMAYGGSGPPYTLEGNSASLPPGMPAVVYQFVPGVFTTALTRALNDPAVDVFLVIEEINRGNCAAIFGDLFQLLDRADNGQSRYPIAADPAMVAHLSMGLTDADKVAAIAAGRLTIPSNLHLLATMNTSDQSLFPMDSAFKRRWEMEYLPIDYASVGDIRVTLRAGANEEKVRWSDFLRHVNDQISATTGSDDKQIGPWFVPLHGAEISQRVFRDKVLSYLWTDVFRHTPTALFRQGITSYDDLVRRFKVGEWVFNDTLTTALGLNH